MQQTKDYREFTKLAGEYFDRKDDSEKEREGKELIEHAKVLKVKGEKESIAGKKIKSWRQSDSMETAILRIRSE